LYSALPIVAAALAVATVPYVVLLVGRRVLVARRERRRAELESRIQPLALELVEGDTDADRASDLTAAEAEALASVLGRYARLLSGDSRSSITAYFEANGLVDRELAILRSLRGWRRAHAARLLGEIGATRAIPALTEALGDRNADVRATAAGSLGRLGAREAVLLSSTAIAAGRGSWATSSTATCSCFRTAAA
jgi:HEAT repeat protein